MRSRVPRRCGRAWRCLKHWIAANVRSVAIALQWLRCIVGRRLAPLQDHSTMGAKHFGARVARLEDPALLTGRGRFVDDVKLPGALHASFVRSPHPHARIRAIDAAAARAMPGVHAVLAADDLPARMARGQIPMLVPNPSIKTPRTQLALARHEVCYVGQTIAVVIADDRYLAEDAAAAVAVDFHVLAAVNDWQAA